MGGAREFSGYRVKLMRTLYTKQLYMYTVYIYMIVLLFIVCYLGDRQTYLHVPVYSLVKYSYTCTCTMYIHVHVLVT